MVFQDLGSNIQLSHIVLTARMHAQYAPVLPADKPLSGSVLGMGGVQHVTRVTLVTLDALGRAEVPFLAPAH